MLACSPEARGLCARLVVELTWGRELCHEIPGASGCGG